MKLWTKNILSASIRVGTLNYTSDNLQIYKLFYVSLQKFKLLFTISKIKNILQTKVLVLYTQLLK